MNDFGRISTNEVSEFLQSKIGRFYSLTVVMKLQTLASPSAVQCKLMVIETGIDLI